MWIAGQILIGLNYFIFWCSRFVKKKEHLILWDCVANIVTILGFLCLGNYNGMENASFSFAKNLGADRVIKHGKKISLIAFIVFISVMIMIYVIDFKGISTVCILICGIVNAFGTFLLNAQGMRITGCVGSMFYFCFSLLSGVVSGAILEAITFAFLFISFLVYHRKPKNQE